MLLALALLLTQDAPAGLTDDDIDFRTRAELRLLEAGPAAVPPLLRGLRSPDSELRARSREVLGSLSPLAWTDHVHTPGTGALFHALHARILSPDWEVKTREFLEVSLAQADTLDALTRTARAERQVVFLLGRLRTENAAGLRTSEIRWRSDDPRREGPVARLRDGAILIGHPADYGSDRPFCVRLLERLSLEPRDAQAALLLADLMTEPMLFGLSLDSTPAAVEVATRYLALHPNLVPDGRFAAAFGRRLHAADWAFLIPASTVATAHPNALAASLREAYASPNRWARFFSAAIAQETGARSLFDPRMFELMREDQPAMRREALFAAFKVAPHDRMPFDLMIDASARIGKNDFGTVREFRIIRETRLGLALVEALKRHRTFALRILDVFKNDARVVDAFCTAAERAAEKHYSGEYLEMLVHYSSGDGRGRTLAALKTFFMKAPLDTGLKATGMLATLLGKDGLDYFETHLGSTAPTIRTRAIEGLYRIALPLDDDDPVRRSVIVLLRKHAEGEKNETALHACRDRLEKLAEERPRTLVGGARRIWCSSGCGGPGIPPRSFRIGWSASPAAAISKPEWK